VLIKKTELGHTTKLIDFDSSYVAGEPPPPEEIVGTIDYYSPELLGYIQEAGVRADELGVASDVFALGLIYTEYLTGAPPPYDPAYHEPAVAARNGVELRIPRAGVLPELADLIDSMLAGDPSRRPTIAAVHAALMNIRPAAGAPASRGSALRGKGLTTARRSTTSATTPASTSTRLVGKLLRKLGEARP
jgi:serine/threonine protein kinase